MSNIAESKPLTSDRFIQPSAVRGHERSHAPKAEHSVFIPALLLASALVLWFAFQTLQLSSERAQLAAIKGNQATQVEAAAKIRVALDSLAASTQRLANSGNANAQLIVQELQKRGVTINANPKPNQ
ncbi:MAG: hypothetical protein H7Z40_10005 [Phycisphaerae bacterium]|nr:hypothetical protein [Gemmatimonadaceae bacterium]